jgi:hypothetical protein
MLSNKHKVILNLQNRNWNAKRKKVGGTVAPVYIPSYSESRDQEDCGHIVPETLS